MKFQSIIDIILNIIHFIYNYFDKYVIKFLVKFIKQPIELIYNQFNYKNKLTNKYYNLILNTFNFQDYKIKILNNKKEIINTQIDIRNKPLLILQNHLDPKKDILTSMYIMNKYLPNNSTFLGTIFSSFNIKFINNIFNTLIKYIIKEISMIYIDWDLNKNKPEKNQLDRINLEASKLYSTNYNLLIYPEGKPTNNSLHLQSFKTGYKHIIKGTEYDTITLISVIYHDDNNNLLLGEKLIKSNDNYFVKVMIENIEIDKKNLTDQYLKSLDKMLVSKMKNNLDKLVKKYTKSKI